MEFEKEKLQWLEFDLLTNIPNLFSASFLRHGGVSEGAFASLNVSDKVGDHHENVKVNRDLVRQVVGVSHLVFAQQNHTDQIVHVRSFEEKIGECDGLITDIADIGLCVTHADCQAAVFYDQEHHCIGIAHGGWRGLVLGIYQKIIDAMHKTFGSLPQNIFVCISPSLGPDHAEFVNYKKEFPRNFWDYQLSDKPHFFNLREIAKMQLLQSGILEKNIEIVPICTYSHPHDYYSYRRDHICGRNGTVIALKK
ncbi:MAG: peptidoglycan editing factor PgeF [Parachlamydiales bacterium]|nr:peptidoglycan editing factor PgeF [Parachlamydiales bacterium]